MLYYEKQLFTQLINASNKKLHLKIHFKCSQSIIAEFFIILYRRHLGFASPVFTKFASLIFSSTILFYNISYADKLVKWLLLLDSVNYSFYSQTAYDMMESYD